MNFGHFYIFRLDRDDGATALITFCSKDAVLNLKTGLELELQPRSEEVMCYMF